MRGILDGLVVQAPPHRRGLNGAVAAKGDEDAAAVEGLPVELDGQLLPLRVEVHDLSVLAGLEDA